MPCCAVITCRLKSQTSSIKQGGISFHRFPKQPDIRSQWIDVTGRENWIPTKHSTICSKHFREDDFKEKKSGHRHLNLGAIPRVHIVRIHTNSVARGGETRRSVSREFEDSRSVTPITDPEDEQDVKMTIDIDEEYKVVIQDPPSQTSTQGSFKQLHSHQPGQDKIHLQPSTSVVEPIIKQEVLDEPEFLDYKAMYYKLLEEVMGLRNQKLFEENQNHIATNRSIGEELEKMIQTNQKYVKDIHNLTLEKQKLKERNQSLIDNIQYLSERINELTEYNTEDNQQRKIDIFDDYIEKIENLNERIKNVTEENKILNERCKKYSIAFRSVSSRNKAQQLYIEKIKKLCSTKLKAKTRVVNTLKQNFVKLKTVLASLQRLQVAVDSL